MTIFIEPDKLICIFCKQEINYYVRGYNYGHKTNKSVEKDGIEYIFCDDYYHNSCAIKNLNKKEPEKKEPDKFDLFFRWFRK